MDTAMKFFGANTSGVDDAGDAGNFQGYTDSYQPLKPCASWCALDVYGAAGEVATGVGVDHSRQAVSGGAVTGHSSIVQASETLSKYGGICGRVLRIDGLLQTYDELHNRQYGTIQEIWVQLQYAYQESLDDSDRTTSATRSLDQANAFGANQLGAGGQGNGLGVKQSGNDWTLDRDYRGDANWPWNYQSYTAADTDGIKYGGAAPGTKYTGRDYDHTPYVKDG